MIYILIPFAVLGFLAIGSLIIGKIGTWRNRRKKSNPNEHNKKEQEYYRGIKKKQGWNNWINENN